MPLSEPTQREPLHLRDIQVHGYHRADGLIDIEGHLTDTKPYPLDAEERGVLPPGTPLHGMWMRLTIDTNMKIVASEACTDFGPYTICPGGAESYSKLVGLTIKAGFLRAANERIGGPAGCTHIREMLQQMATTAFQTMWPIRSRLVAEARRKGHDTAQKDRAEAKDSDGAARLLNSCFAYASDRAVVKQRWPHLYSGSDAAQLTAATSRET
jgi:hypothetical protein